jgi:uncharacterized protein with HEPN domain
MISSRCSSLPPSLGDRLSHISKAIEDIYLLVRGHSLEDFAADLTVRLAVERLFEIISEASRSIPENIKAKEKDIPWPRIADLGNWLRHAYHRVDAEILWNIIENDLEALARFVERLTKNQ